MKIMPRVEARLNHIIRTDGKVANYWYRLKNRLRRGQRLTPKMEQDIAKILKTLDAERRRFTGT
jgi:hypothetical protein